MGSEGNVGRKRVRLHGEKKTHSFLSVRETWVLVLLATNIGEGNGTPLQYSCLENPMDRGAWWAAVCGSLRVGHD